MSNVIISFGKDQPESEDSRDADPGIKSPPAFIQDAMA
jgi:hypothetical protein